MFVLVGAGVLVMGLFAGTVLAQETDDSGDNPGLFGRVAEILGLAEDDVKDAFDQARTEIHDERSELRQENLSAHLDELIESGELTEEEAAEIRERLESLSERFEDFPRIDGRSFGFRRHGFGFREGDGHSFRFEFRTGATDSLDVEGLFPNFDELKEHFESLEGFDSLEGIKGFRHFEGPGFKFYFGPEIHDGEADGDEETAAEQDLPVDGTSL